MDVGAVLAEAMEGIDGRASVSSGTLPDGQIALQPAQAAGGPSPSPVDPGEMTERLKSSSMNELKTLLRARKMKLSGTKTDLIARLVSNAMGVDESGGASAKGASRLNQTQLNLIKVRSEGCFSSSAAHFAGQTHRCLRTVITQVAEHRKDLNAHVRTLAKMVDDDWHDGWEEQGHELQVSVKSLQDFLDHA